MNNKTRTKLRKAIKQIEELKNLISEIASEEQDKFDNLPEGLQESENGCQMEEASTALEEAYNNLEEATENMETAIG